MKGFAGVLLAAVIQFLKREKRAEAKNKQDPSANSTGASEESTGLTAVTLRQPYIRPLHCCIVLRVKVKEAPPPPQLRRRRLRNTYKP